VRWLHLSYDGLTGHIGQSQIWPYLAGLAAAGHEIEALSFEQRDRRARIGVRVGRDLAAAGIVWHPQPFRTRPPLMAKWLDHRRMTRAAMALAGSGRVGALHARSLVAADAALAVKRRHGTPLIFDMRGFWADERADGGRWPRDHPLWGRLYRHWKRREAVLIGAADRIVVLSEAARAVVEAMPAHAGQPVAVIPCAVDHDVFAPADPATRAAARAALGAGPDAPVLACLGALGTLYPLDAMLRFFAAVTARHPGARLLFIGGHDRGAILAAGCRAGLALDPDAIAVRAVENAAVPGELAAADLGLAFRVPMFSSLGAAPIKVAEYLACGVPVIANAGTGDVASLLARLGAGHVLPDLSDGAMAEALDRVPALMALDRGRIAAHSRAEHDLTVAVGRYDALYRSVAAGR